MITRQFNGQMKKDKNGLQNTTQKNKRPSNKNPTKNPRVNECSQEG